MADLLVIIAVIAVLWLAMQWGASFQAKEKPKSPEEELGKALKRIIDSLK